MKTMIKLSNREYFAIVAEIDVTIHLIEMSHEKISKRKPLEAMIDLAVGIEKENIKSVTKLAQNLLKLKKKIGEPTESVETFLKEMKAALKKVKKPFKPDVKEEKEGA